MEKTQWLARYRVSAIYLGKVQTEGMLIQYMVLHTFWGLKKGPWLDCEPLLGGLEPRDSRQITRSDLGSPDFQLW
eukprot:1160236-Pelagomonas_calceolata.AAC.1